IKLADRLHNMRTLQYKSEFKQKENSLETMEIFVPLAYYIGAYRIKSELEDISFGYLYPKNDSLTSSLILLSFQMTKHFC
ncbi:MAG: HD domain-containing protein, partial [Bacteroidales bacterium]|nr:HD domain-containing protein [Bacteroidales bacterium]